MYVLCISIGFAFFATSSLYLLSVRATDYAMSCWHAIALHSQVQHCIHITYTHTHTKHIHLKKEIWLWTRVCTLLESLTRCNGIYIILIFQMHFSIKDSIIYLSALLLPSYFDKSSQSMYREVNALRKRNTEIDAYF